LASVGSHYLEPICSRKYSTFLKIKIGMKITIS
jgi:hypothetical protein